MSSVQFDSSQSDPRNQGEKSVEQRELSKTADKASDKVHQETDAKSHFSEGHQQVAQDQRHTHQLQLEDQKNGLLPVAEIVDTQAPKSLKPANNADKVSSPTESDKTKDHPADVNAAAKQAEIYKLEVMANTPGTALNKYINEYYLGVAQNDHDGIPNQHDASVHGFPETSTAADRQQIPGLQNSALVRPGLYRGANPGGSGDGAPWDPDQLITNLVNLHYDQGVNTVISFEEKNDPAKWDNNVAGKIDAEREVCKQLNINFYNIPLDQSYHGQKLTDQGKAFLDIVNQPGVVAYGHCREGIDRTGYMMAQAEMNPPKKADGTDVVPAKSAQEAAQDQVNHGYGKNKQKDYNNLFLPGADYHHADTHKNWTEVSKVDLESILDGLQELRTAARKIEEELPHN